MRTIKRFLPDQTAATAIEYALVASGIALGIFVAMSGLGSAMSSVFTGLSTSFK